VRQRLLGVPPSETPSNEAFSCGSGEPDKPPVRDAKDYKPESGKLSDLRPGGASSKGAGTSTAQ